MATESTQNRPGAFTKGDPRTKEAARRGGLVRAAKAQGWYPPFEGTAVDVMDAAGLTGPTWVGTRAIVKASDALPMTDAELAFFRRHTDREHPPEAPIEEVVLVCGRRGGKTRLMGTVGFHAGISFDTRRLAPGEQGVVMLIAADRKQARQLLGYMRGLAQLEPFAGYVHRVLKESIELVSGVVIEVHTCSHRSTRGFTCIACLCDETAFWRTDDGSANPDTEVLAAVRPSMATIEGAKLYLASSPYAARGELYRQHERYWGKDDPHVLVVNADTRSLNPSVADRIIERAFEEDPVAAASEYGADGRVQFRRDVEAFLDPEAVKAVTVEGRRELPYRAGVRYVAFVDPSGGSQDSFTLAIAHGETELAVLDAVREVRPPFSPDDVVRDFAELLRSYGVREVTGDRYGGEWPRERFQRHGITYRPSERTKSDIYREFVAPVNGGKVALLDLPVLRAQLVGLERKVARGGRDSIDHAPGGRDDVSNAAAGALGLVTVAKRRNIPIVGTVHI